MWVDHLNSNEQNLIKRLRQWYPELGDRKMRLLKHSYERIRFGEAGSAWYQPVVQKIIEYQENKQKHGESMQLYSKLSWDEAIQWYKEIFKKAQNTIVRTYLSSKKDTPLVPMTQLPKEFAELKYLDTLQINFTKLQSLKNVPEKIEHLILNSCTISSFEGLPKELHSLQRLIIKNFPLKSLRGLPKTLPNLRELEIEHTPLRSLEGLPRMPQLHHLYIQHSKLTNYFGIEEFIEVNPDTIISLDNNPIISLYGLPDEKISSLRYNPVFTKVLMPDKIPSSYLPYFELDFVNLTKMPECFNYLRLYLPQNI